MNLRKVFIFGVPSNAGCLLEGTELSPEHFRKSGLVKLVANGREIVDLGNVPLPTLQRHNNPPIRNYPSPKIVWESVAGFLEKILSANDKALFLCLGGDCSIVVGTTSGMMHRFGDKQIHLLYLDGDVDSIAPNPEQCAGSAGMGLWLLTQESNYWNRNKLPLDSITVIGNKNPPPTDFGIPFVLLQRLRAQGINSSITNILDDIPKSKRILVHIDVDVLSEHEMPAAYSPREAGLSLLEFGQILKIILADERVAFIEVTEFFPPKDPDGRLARLLADTISNSLE